MCIRDGSGPDPGRAAIRAHDVDSYPCHGVLLVVCLRNGGVVCPTAQDYRRRRVPVSGVGFHHRSITICPATARTGTGAVRQSRASAARADDRANRAHLHSLRLPPAGAGTRHLLLGYCHDKPLGSWTEGSALSTDHAVSNGTSSRASSVANGDSRDSECPSQEPSFRSAPHTGQRPRQDSEHSGTSGTDKHNSS